MLPCVLLTLNIFSALHTSILPSPLSILFIPARLTVCVRRAYHWFSQDPWEKCRSAVQCEGLFGYQTSSSNLHGVNLNIAVSCRLPRGPGRAREGEKEKRKLEYSFYVAFKCITFYGGAWPHSCQKRPLSSRLVGGRRSQVCAS